MTQPVIVGLVGGIASGKSTVARLFAKLGALIVDADQIGHQILDEKKIMDQIREIWGEQIFEGGRIQRNLLARIVFDPADNRKELTKLEGITHPRIRERIQDEMKEAAEAGFPAVVLDIPLLFEAGWDRICHKIIFVEADAEVRKRRALARGWTKEHWLMREKQQVSVSQKRNNSSDIVNNSNDQEDTFQQVRSLWIRWGLSVPEDLCD